MYDGIMRKLYAVRIWFRLFAGEIHNKKWNIIKVINCGFKF